jgi:thioredoxin reductase
VVTAAAGSFDGGRADVPGGAAGPAERVVVVGAGIAGLTVANGLGQAGAECVVLEARPDRTYADGALTTGIREAKRLLGQPGVSLGPPGDQPATTGR